MRTGGGVNSRPIGALLFGTFVLAQLSDGLLTYHGIATFGTEIEANPIVAWYVSTMGTGTALIAVKTTKSILSRLVKTYDGIASSRQTRRA